MSYTRLRQLSEMYSFVTNISQADALRIICSTTTGKRIAEGCASFLYEQQTSNLASIVAELPPEVQKKFTAQKIYQSMQALKKSTHMYQMVAIPEFKSSSRKSLKKLQKKRLEVASANQIMRIKELRREAQGHVNNSKK